MGPKQRSEKDLVDVLDHGLAEDVLADDYPMEHVDDELRHAGADPAAIGKWGAGLVAELAKKRRLAWRPEAQKKREVMQAKLAQRALVGPLSRAELLARIEAARQDPRLKGPVAMAARNLTGEPSEEELRQIVEDIEALALLAGGDGDDKK